jgi:hypothetical protein
MPRAHRRTTGAFQVALGLIVAALEEILLVAMEPRTARLTAMSGMVWREKKTGRWPIRSTAVTKRS